MAKDLKQMMTEAWPWAPPFLRLLREDRNEPFQGSHLLFSSDYSGEHHASGYTTYAFVIADADASPQWPNAVRRVRKDLLPDARRMAFKGLNDKHRQRVLIPFLEAAELLVGHVVVVAVTKEMMRLSTSPQSSTIWRNLQGLRGRWDARAFEKMSGIAHFFTLILSVWTKPYMDISWITDEDDIVANEDRLDDAHQFAAKLAGIYLPHPLGVFMMNTPAVEPGNLAFEDLLAIPDLSAGMLSEVLTISKGEGTIGSTRIANDDSLTNKSEVIADWFWHDSGTLKKTCFILAKTTDGRFGIEKYGESSSLTAPYSPHAEVRSTQAQPPSSAS